MPIHESGRSSTGGRFRSEDASRSELNNRRHGWESDHLVTGTVVLPTAAYPGDAEVTEFQRLALERLEALPGVASASVSYSMPFFGLAEPRKVLIEDRETPEPGREPVAVINGVSPLYFETVGTRVLSGRAFSALALLGLGLAALGIYGVTARTTAQRRGEFGIRLALGSRAGDITRLVLTSGGKLALAGSALGLLGAFGVSPLFAAAFPAMRIHSAPVFVGVTLLLVAIAQLACYLPARRAARISPSETLRAE